VILFWNLPKNSQQWYQSLFRLFEGVKEAEGRFLVAVASPAE